MITVKKAISGLRRAVRERGKDYCYLAQLKSIAGPDGESCVYFDPNGNPSCIIGHVFYYNGITPQDLSIDGFNVRANASNIYSIDVAGGVTPKARELLAKAQTTQDSGGTWGAALEEALDRAR